MIAGRIRNQPKAAAATEENKPRRRRGADGSSVGTLIVYGVAMPQRIEADGTFSRPYAFGASSNSVEVTGGGSSWHAGTTSIGSSGSGNSLVIANGGSVSSAASFIGSNAGSVGNHALVTGTGSDWAVSESLYVGYGGSGNTLVISDAGSISASYCLLGYTAGSGSNHVLVTGSGSTLDNSWNLVVGYDGSGNSLAVSDGASVRSFIG